MLPVLNNTRNAQDIRKKWKELVPFSLSAVWKWEPRNRIPWARSLGLWPWGHSPHTGLTAGKHRLVTGFRYPLPTSSPKNHASQLREHKHNEQSDLLSKDHKSLNKLPSQQQKPPSFGQKLAFQIFSTTEMPAASEVQQLEPDGKGPATVPCASFRLGRKSKWKV